MTVSELYRALDARIPRDYACAWDNDGLSCCPDPDAPVTGILIALDATEDAAAAAEKRGFNVLLTHHPMLFRGLKAVAGADTGSRKVIGLIRSGISSMAFHTRLDALPGGVNDVLAKVLGLSDVVPFGDGHGEDGNAAGMPIGRIGVLPEAESFDAFCARVKTALHLPAILGADCGKPVRRVAVLGGAGDDEVSAAHEAGADVFVTGELRYHQLCDAPFSGMSLINAGHYHTEYPVLTVLRRMVGEIYAEAGEPLVPIETIGSCRVQIR